MLKNFEISIEENMSLLVTFTQKVTNTGEDDHPIEVNADKIVSVRIPEYPAPHSNNIRQLIPGYPAPFGFAAGERLFCVS
ncbi:MAG: hypothetical protein GY743_14260 [Planctomycetaceae bacterium]|nr:hypothetical protein [Planctomycetaceae bacterium]